MIRVIASITVKEGELAKFLEIFKANVPLVQAEEGCIEYYPTIDVDSGLPVQMKDPSTVTIIEKWQSLAALHAHLTSPHMLAYRKETKDIVEKVSLRVLQEI
ncbi:MAG: antibiotic biosynthesis monooxygenase [Deltaproteobacteria bacterium]|nr:antibiotic biosynthesis monooxygenase [Deltaproteobacteria bacterium]